jgi:hypothetical protein
MPNKAIHQLQEATELQDGDVLIIARPSGGDFIDRKIDAATFPQRVQYLSVTVPSASVLTLGTTPFTLIPAPTAGTAIFVKAALMSMVSGATDYTTSIQVNLAADGGDDFLTVPIDNAGGSPLIANAALGGNLVDGATIELNAGGVNPEDGDYDLVFQLWYQVITL